MVCEKPAQDSFPMNAMHPLEPLSEDATQQEIMKRMEALGLKEDDIEEIM